MPSPFRRTEKILKEHRAGRSGKGWKSLAPFYTKKSIHQDNLVAGGLTTESALRVPGSNLSRLPQNHWLVLR